MLWLRLVFFRGGEYAKMAKRKHHYNHRQKPDSAMREKSVRRHSDFHHLLTQIKLYVVEIAATIFFVAFVLCFLMKELRGLFQ
jgi:hypothetical protein